MRSSRHTTPIAGKTSPTSPKPPSSAVDRSTWKRGRRKWYPPPFYPSTVHGGTVLSVCPHSPSKTYTTWASQGNAYVHQRERRGDSPLLLSMCPCRGQAGHTSTKGRRRSIVPPHPPSPFQNLCGHSADK